MNKFVQDCLDMYDLWKEFHYSWVILLLEMITWNPPPRREYTTPTTTSFPMPKFNELQYSMYKTAQRETNIAFQLWYMDMLITTTEEYRVPRNLVERYNDFIYFEVDTHNVFITLHSNLSHPSNILPFYITNEDIVKGITDQIIHLR